MRRIQSVGLTAAWKTLTSQPRRASSLDTSRGTIVPAVLAAGDFASLLAAGLALDTTVVTVGLRLTTCLKIFDVLVL